MDRVRVGVDVGGTFTHAVAVDNQSLELLGEAKVPTTHRAAEGVAAGVIQSLNELLQSAKINAADISFIAHSTTQATNSLLEGDVVSPGVIGMGKGLEAGRAKGETKLPAIEITSGKKVQPLNQFYDTASGVKDDVIRKLLSEFIKQNVKVAVAAEAFSTDDPTNENKVTALGKELGLAVTGTHEISELYGLRARTRTAVINACMLPKMMDAAEKTENAVKQSGITAPLMVVRSDGGVMTTEEMRRRPILTMLSGPAAGVAAALMYVKISDGIFVEVGGTSTDITVIRDGKALIRSAEVGGHKLYLKTLDTRTVGLAGGSLPRIKDGKVTEVGPRSAHIAGLPYACFTPPEKIVSPSVELIAPLPGDPADYAVIKSSNGERYAVTMTCAANVLGLIPEGECGFGHKASAVAALEPLARRLKKSVTDAARDILEAGSRKLSTAINGLIKEYQLVPADVVLVGGGGGAPAVVRFLASEMKLPYELSPHTAVVSSIGAALALVHETIERTIVNPTAADLADIRRRAEDAVIKMGAKPETVRVEITVDAHKNIVRASASGATELRTKELGSRELSLEEQKKIAAASLRLPLEDIKMVAELNNYTIFGGTVSEPYFFGLFKRSFNSIRVVDREGIIRLRKRQGQVLVSKVQSLETDLKNFIASFTRYGDAGELLPQVFLVIRAKLVDLSGLIELNQILALAKMEVEGLAADEEIGIVVGI